MKFNNRLVHIISEFPNTADVKFGPFLDYKNGELNLLYLDYKGKWNSYWFYDVESFALINSEDKAVSELCDTDQYEVESDDEEKEFIIGFNENGGSFVHIKFKTFKMVTAQQVNERHRTP